MLPTILKYKLHQTYNTLTRSSRQKKLGWLISIAFIIPYYVTFMRYMREMYGDLYGTSQWEGLFRMVSANLAIIFYFVLASTAALTLYRMFQAKDLPLLMSLPAGDGSLFLAKLVESLADAGRSMILPSPICLAFISALISKARSPLSAAIFLIGWFGIMIQLVGLSVIIALVLGRIIATSRWAVFFRIALPFTAALVFLSIFFLGYTRSTGLGILPSKFALLPMFSPTSWLLRLLPVAVSPAGNRLLYGIGFVAAIVGLPAIAFQLFKRRFRQVWSMVMEVKSSRSYVCAPVASGNLSKPASTGVKARHSGKTRAVILKEMRVMYREPYILVGLVIPLVLFPIFVLSGSRAPDSQLVYIVLVSLLTTTSYSLSSVGREGRAFPLLRALPMRMSVVLRAKFILSGIINLGVTLALVIAMHLIQRSPLNQLWHNSFTAVSTSVCFAAFGTALAAIFPKFDFTNPMRAASVPGILVLYLIAFAFIVTFILTAPAGWYLNLLILVPWAFAALILLRIAQKRLESIDV